MKRLGVRWTIRDLCEQHFEALSIRFNGDVHVAKAGKILFSLLHTQA
jgi:hypothetical protein